MTWRLDDARRLDAIGEADLYPGVPEPTMVPYAKIVAGLLGVPVALVSIVTDDRQFFPAQVGVGEPWASRGETPLSMSFCQHVVTGDAPLVVPDAMGDDRVAGNLAIEELDVIAYLGVPLRAPSGEPLGSLCAIDHRPRAWSDHDLAVLEDVADAVAQAIALRTSEHRWAGFAAEASHRLRTPVTAMRLELDDLQQWPSLPDDARAAVATAAEHATALSSLIDHLTALARARRRHGTEPVALDEAVRAAADQVGVEAAVSVDGPTQVSTVAGVLRSVLVELLTDLAAAGPVVAVDVSVGNGMARLRLSAPEGAARLDVRAPLRERVRNQLGGRLAAADRDGVPTLELTLPADD